MISKRKIPEYRIDRRIGAVGSMKREASHRIAEEALTLLQGLDTGEFHDRNDVTSLQYEILLPVCDRYFRKLTKEFDLTGVKEGEYAIGQLQLPMEKEKRILAMRILETIAEQNGCRMLGCRSLLSWENGCFVQMFLEKPDPVTATDAFERLLYRIRRVFEKNCAFASLRSLSSRVIVYDMLPAMDFDSAFADLLDPDYFCSFALCQAILSPGTKPVPASHVMIMQGEITTIGKNVERMKEREAQFVSPCFKHSMHQILPVLSDTTSDAGLLDQTLEFLFMNSRPIGRAVSMLRGGAPSPEFYSYSRFRTEVWDGPAALIVTDGEGIGAIGDPYGIHNLWQMTDQDGVFFLASNPSVFAEAARQYRAQKKKVQIDPLKAGQLYPLTLLPDHSLDYFGEWMSDAVFALNDQPIPDQPVSIPEDRELNIVMKAFGYSFEDLFELLPSFVREDAFCCAVSGSDIPLSFLSNQNPLFSEHFHQRFYRMQLPVSKKAVSLEQWIGEEESLLTDGPFLSEKQILSSPVLTDRDLQKLKACAGDRLSVLSTCFYREKKLTDALDALGEEAVFSVSNGALVLLLSDTKMDELFLPIPVLLAAAAVKEALVKTKNYSGVSIFVSSGEVKDVHSFAALLGIGVKGIHPHLVYQALRYLFREGKIRKEGVHAELCYRSRIEEGLCQILNALGMNTLSSFSMIDGMEIFGLSKDICEKYFPHVTACSASCDLEEVEKVQRQYHRMAYEGKESFDLPVKGILSFRNGGEVHRLSPKNLLLLLQALKTGEFASYLSFAAAAGDPENGRFQNLFSLTPGKREAASETGHKDSRIGSMIWKRERAGEKDTLLLMHGETITLEQILAAKRLEIVPVDPLYPKKLPVVSGEENTPEFAMRRGICPGIDLWDFGCPLDHADGFSLSAFLNGLRRINPELTIGIRFFSESGVEQEALFAAGAGVDYIRICGCSQINSPAEEQNRLHTGLPMEIGLYLAHRELCQNALRKNVTLVADGSLLCGEDLVFAALLGADRFVIDTEDLMDRLEQVEGCTFESGERQTFEKRYLSLLIEETEKILSVLGMPGLSSLIGRMDLLEGEDLPDSFPLPKTDPGSCVSVCLSDAPSAKEEGKESENEDVIELLPQVLKKEHHDLQLYSTVPYPDGFGAFLSDPTILEVKEAAGDGLGRGLSGGTIVQCKDPAVCGNFCLFGARKGSLFLAGKAGDYFALQNEGAHAVAEGIGAFGCSCMREGRVVILGPVSEGFADRMTGGIAYVLDEAHTLYRYVDPKWVVTETIQEKEDAAVLKKMLIEHREKTGSKKAEQILDRFSEYLPKFKKVIPRKYRKILKRMDSYEKTGDEREEAMRKAWRDEWKR